MQVNITKRIDTPLGRRYCPILIGPDSRVQADWVTVKGHKEKQPEGTYYLDWMEGGKRRHVSVGSDAIAAQKSRTRKQRKLNAIEPGLIRPNRIDKHSKLRVGSAADEFLDEIQLCRQRKTWMGYRLSLRYFQESCRKSFLREIERKELLHFTAFLRVATRPLFASESSPDARPANRTAQVQRLPCTRSTSRQRPFCGPDSQTACHTVSSHFRVHSGIAPAEPR